MVTAGVRCQRAAIAGVFCAVAWTLVDEWSRGTTRRLFSALAQGPGPGRAPRQRAGGVHETRAGSGRA